MERGQEILRKCLAGCQESWGAGGLQTSMWASCCAVGTWSLGASVPRQVTDMRTSWC